MDKSEETLSECECGFFEHYLEFREYLEFRIIDTKTLHPKTKRPIMRSVFARNIQEVQNIKLLYDHPGFIVYVSCNTRGTETRFDAGVTHRRTFFFDIEATGEKPPLSDPAYYQELLSTALYIWKGLYAMGINPNYLGESGRGLHVGIKLKPLCIAECDGRFRVWHKRALQSLMRKRPHNRIKFNDTMVNPSRIQSCPGFIHYKYPEQPKRRILKLFFHENDIIPIIERIPPLIAKKRYAVKYKKKYDDSSFYESPEWLLLENNPDLPEGEIHNKIWLTIKLLARDNGLDKSLLQEKASLLGYNEFIDTPSDEYQYSPWILFSWAMRNAEFCLSRKIVLPHPFDKPKNIIHSDDSPLFKYSVLEEIDSFSGVLRYIRKYNYHSAIRKGDKVIVFSGNLWAILAKGVKPSLFNYINFLGLKPYIAGLFYALESDR